jgi:hypothetical protein
MFETNQSVEWHTAADREALLARWKVEIEAERVNLERCYRLPLDRVAEQIFRAIEALSDVVRELDALAAYDRALMRRLVAVREGTRLEDGSPLE